MTFPYGHGVYHGRVFMHQYDFHIRNSRLRKAVGNRSVHRNPVFLLFLHLRTVRLSVNHYCDEGEQCGDDGFPVHCSLIFISPHSLSR